MWMVLGFVDKDSETIRIFDSEARRTGSALSSSTGTRDTPAALLESFVCCLWPEWNAHLWLHSPSTLKTTAQISAQEARRQGDHTKTWLADSRHAVPVFFEALSLVSQASHLDEATPSFDPSLLARLLIAFECGDDTDAPTRAAAMSSLVPLRAQTLRTMRLYLHSPVESETSRAHARIWSALASGARPDQLMATKWRARFHVRVAVEMGRYAGADLAAQHAWLARVVGSMRDLVLTAAGSAVHDGVDASVVVAKDPSAVSREDWVVGMLAHRERIDALADLEVRLERMMRELGHWRGQYCSLLLSNNPQR